MFFNRSDGDRFEAFLDHAIAFAKTILRADPAANLGHVVGGGSEFIGLLHPPLGGHPQPIRDIVVERTMHLAEGDSALFTAGGLL